VRPPSLFRPRAHAILDSSLRERVGFEIYYFSNTAEKARFRKDPLRYCGLLTDPVSMVRFQPTRSSPRTTFGGRVYYFSSDSTRARFLENPTLHQDRRTGTS
jgi:YHS domain-containing protein